MLELVILEFIAQMSTAALLTIQLWQLISRQNTPEYKEKSKCHSEIGAMADFISVSQETGNTSSILEEQVLTLIVTSALFRANFLLIQEKLAWMGCIAIFFTGEMVGSM